MIGIVLCKGKFYAKIISTQKYIRNTLNKLFIQMKIVRIQFIKHKVGQLKPYI